MAELLKTGNYTQFGIIKELQHLASGDNIIFTIIDKSGKSHNAEVHYNSTTNKISSPTIHISPIIAQYSYLQLLPIETLHEIVTKMYLNDVLNLCQTNSDLNTKICDNQNFWRKKVIEDFGLNFLSEINLIKMTLTKLMPIINWKEIYKNTGNVYSFGNNEDGQLGLGDNINRNTPIKIPKIKAKFVSAGYDHSLLIDLNNNVWSFGRNEWNQLGLGDINNRNIPIQIPNIKAKIISAGRNHSLLIDLNNNVWSFGRNESGQLGISSLKKIIYIPEIIPNIKAKDISAGNIHSLIIDENNSVLSFGMNLKGQLGLGDNKRRNIPTLIPKIKAKFVSTREEQSLIIDLNGNVWIFGELRHGVTSNIPIQIDMKAKFISAGESYSLIIDENNIVWSFGCDVGGRLGLGDNITRDKPAQIFNINAKDISAGWFHSLIIDLENRVFSFGYNNNGQLGLNNNFSRNIPIKIPNIKAKSISTGGMHSLLISYF